MKTRRVRAGLLGLAALATGITTLAPAAHASGSCSITVPARIVITSNSDAVTATAGSDCAASDTQDAGWSITAGGLQHNFDLPAGRSTSSYTFSASIESVGRMTAVPTGATDSSNTAVSQNSPSFTIKYGSWAYSASSRHTTTVYVNGLIHQWGMVDSSVSVGRTVYTQRYLSTGWQTVLSRTTDARGRLAVGFAQPKVYQYRWVAAEGTEQWGATSASTFR